MANPFRNLRLPGTRPRAYRGRSGVVRRGPSNASRVTSETRFAVRRVERPKPKREWRVPWRRIGIATFGVTSVCGVLYGAAWLVTGDTLRVQQIDITGAQVVDPHTVAVASDLGGESMLTLDLGRAEQALEALPAVKDASVTRDWPHGVSITVQEHQAWGYWQAAGQVYVIDADGNVLQAARPAPEGAPTIIDVASPQDLAGGHVADPDTVHLVARLLEDRVFQQAGLEPTGFIFKRDRGLTVIAEDGPDAVFGDSSNYEFKVQAFEEVLQQLQDREQAGAPQVAEVDLRFGRNVVLR